MASTTGWAAGRAASARSSGALICPGGRPAGRGFSYSSGWSFSFKGAGVFLHLPPASSSRFGALLSTGGHRVRRLFLFVDGALWTGFLPLNSCTAPEKVIQTMRARTWSLSETKSSGKPVAAKTDCSE